MQIYPATKTLVGGLLVGTMLAGCATTRIHQLELPVPPEHIQKVKECMTPSIEGSIGRTPFQITTSDRHNPFTVFSKSSLSRAFYGHKEARMVDTANGSVHPVIRVAFDSGEIRALIKQFSDSLGHVLWMKPDILLKALKKPGAHFRKHNRVYQSLPGSLFRRGTPDLSGA